MENTKAMQAIIEKYFGDDRNMCFQNSDAYRNRFGEVFLTYSYIDHNKAKVLISMGGDQIDECPIRICGDAQQLEKLITAIIY